MSLHYVDPHRPHGYRYTALMNFGRSRPGQFFARHVSFHVDPWLYRTTGGRYPRVLGGTVTAPLASTGAKSGRPRVCQLAYFHDGPDVIVLASNSAKPTNPGWYHELEEQPRLRPGRRRIPGHRGDRCRRVHASLRARRAGLRRVRRLPRTGREGRATHPDPSAHAALKTAPRRPMFHVEPHPVSPPG